MYSGFFLGYFALERAGMLAPQRGSPCLCCLFSPKFYSACIPGHAVSSGDCTDYRAGVFFTYPMRLPLLYPHGFFVVVHICQPLVCVRCLS